LKRYFPDYADTHEVTGDCLPPKRCSSTSRQVWSLAPSYTEPRNHFLEHSTTIFLEANILQFIQQGVSENGNVISSGQKN
jgi:hypothetical protein